MTNRVGQQLGDYRLIRLIGHGSFSDVYVGEHLYLNRLDAIKVLLTQSMDFDSGDFLVEARTLANLKHPNIVRVLNFGISDNVPFLVLDYAPNGSLRQRHPRGTKLPLSTVASYVREVASALQYAHSQGLIHRDIKPENMLLDGNGDVLLSDFGLVMIARSTRSLVLQETPGGTPLYMAPEQIQGKPRPASDQYSLGVVVYEWLCGECPFQGRTFELCSQHLFAAPPPLHEKNPTIPPAIEQVVMKTLEKDYHQRFASVQDFADALEHAIEQALLSSPIEVQPPIADSASSESASTSGPTLPVLPPFEPSKAAAPVLSVPKQDYIPVLPPSQPPVPVQPQTRSERKLSRRTVGFGLAGLAVVVASGVGVLAWEDLFNKGPSGAYSPTGTTTPGSTSTPHTTSTSAPATPPPGTLLYPPIVHQPLAVFSVAWSPDGKHIASGWGDNLGNIPKDNMALIWDATTGANVLQYPSSTDKVKSVAWSPNNRLVAFGSLDGTIHIWDISTGKDAISPYTAHSKPTRSVAWSPDGKSIVSSSEDMTVKVWDAATGQLKFTCQPGHTATVYTVAWSPNGKYIASGSDDQNVNIYDARTGTRLASYRLHTSRVSSLAWSPSPASTLIASASYDKTVRVWDALTGKDVLSSPYTGHTDRVETVAWSPDGKHIASGGDDRMVRVWEATTGKSNFPPYTAHHDKVWTVAWSPDGKYIVSGSFDSTVQVWWAV